MNCKQQLQAFYAKQGLTGKHRRQAMRYDMRAIRALRDRYSPEVGVGNIQSMFLFCGAPQDIDYWYFRAFPERSE